MLRCIPSCARLWLFRSGVYLPAHKLPLWRQCNSHWHTLTQPSWMETISVFWYPLVLMASAQIGAPYGPTWQCSLTAYTYPRLAFLGSTWANLGPEWPSQVWLLSSSHVPWTSAFHQTTTPNSSGLFAIIHTELSKLVFLTFWKTSRKLKNS